VPGLALQVIAHKSPDEEGRPPTRTWVLRASIGGRRRDMGLGGYPEVSLKDARTAARVAREKIRSGIDPIEERRAAKSELLAGKRNVLIFKDAAAAYISAHEAGWKNQKHGQQWANSLAAHAYPHMGDLSVADIGLTHILAALEPIWSTKTETATRLRGRIELVLDWATIRGHRSGPNPARWRGHLDKVLPRPSKVTRVEHHSALPSSKVREFMVRLRSAAGQGARALEFAILTAARSGEVRGAMWAEIDLEEKVWKIPGSRMKAGREHRVPLSAAALDVLKAQPLIAGSDIVFAAPRGGPLSDMTLSAVLRRMEVAAVPHGFRSTFRDWASESGSYSHEVCEMALAHSISNKAEAAYRRGDLFEKRRELMRDWAEFVSPSGGGTEGQTG
jgi:integrase